MLLKLPVHDITIPWMDASVKWMEGWIEGSGSLPDGSARKEGVIHSWPD